MGVSVNADLFYGYVWTEEWYTERAAANFRRAMDATFCDDGQRVQAGHYGNDGRYSVLFVTTSRIETSLNEAKRVSRRWMADSSVPLLPLWDQWLAEMVDYYDIDATTAIGPDWFLTATRF